MLRRGSCQSRRIADIGLRRRAQSGFQISGSDQLSIPNSTYVRDDDTELIGIGPRLRRMLAFAAATAAVILFAPIFLITSIAIRLDSRGLIFVREPQLGPSNRVIQVSKFRWVTTRTERSIWPRPTRIGLVLAGSGLDLLPQLFNVLRREMSLAELLRAIERDGVF